MIDFVQDYILENNRVRLEPLNLNHIRELLVISKEDNLWTYFIGESNGENRFEEYVEEAIRRREYKKEYSFAVYDKLHKKYVGSSRFFNISPELLTLRMGYTWYGKEYRSTGLNKNCKYLLMKFAFEQLNAERLGIGCHSENAISISAIQSVGFIKEGVTRNLFPSIDKQGRSDAILFGMLKDEWYSAKKDLENGISVD